MEENKILRMDTLYNADYRLNTMRRWTTPVSDRRSLAEAGFYYIDYTNTRDLIGCAYCPLEISSSTWEAGVDPVEIHKKLSPRCSYIIRLKASSAAIFQPLGRERSVDLNMNKTRKPSEVARESIFKVNSKYTPMFYEYVSEEERLKSFKSASWPSHFKSQPDYLSKAGFFYLGRKTNTACFQCGGAYEFEEEDDAFVEHEHFFPSCYYVVRHKQSEVTTQLTLHIQKTLDGIASPLPDLVSSSVQLANLKLNSEEDENKNLCKICFHGNWSKLFYPCGHVACGSCAKNLKNCPFCRQHVKERVRIFTDC